MGLTYLDVRLLILALVCIKYSVIATEYGGELRGDHTISRSGSPHTVTQDLVVAPQSKLTVEPGTELRFSQGVGLRVHGELKAEVRCNTKLLILCY